MNQIEALRRLEALGLPGFETRNAAELLDVTAANANVILRRLADHGFLVHAARGRWMIARRVNALLLPELISAPYPAYVSLQTALFHHGLIEQVPSVIYAVTLARPRRIATPLATVSLHRVPPELFSGFEVGPSGDFNIATAEKALFDLFYLSQSRIRLFSALPELEFPRNFDWKLLRGYAARIPSAIRRAAVIERIDKLKP